MRPGRGPTRPVRRRPGNALLSAARWHAPTVSGLPDFRPRRHGPGVNAVDWNFATLWESVRDSLPDRIAIVRGEQRRTWNEFDDRAAAARAGPRRGGPRARRKGRVVPLQRQRVHGGTVRHVQDARRRGQRELPVPRGRARLPPRQLRCRGAVLPQQPRRSRRQDPRSRAAREALDRGRRRWCTPGVRGALRGSDRDERPDAAHRALGRRHVLPLHRRHDRHAEGRHVAVRRPVGRARRRDLRARRRDVTDAARRRRTAREAHRRSARHRAPSRVAAHARNRGVHVVPVDLDRRRASSRSRAGTSTPTSCGAWCERER